MHAQDTKLKRWTITAIFTSTLKQWKDTILLFQHRSVIQDYRQNGGPNQRPETRMSAIFAQETQNYEAFGNPQSAYLNVQ